MTPSQNGISSSRKRAAAARKPAGSQARRARNRLACASRYGGREPGGIASIEARSSSTFTESPSTSAASSASTMPSSTAWKAIPRVGPSRTSPHRPRAPPAAVLRPAATPPAPRGRWNGPERRSTHRGARTSRRRAEPRRAGPRWRWISTPDWSRPSTTPPASSCSWVKPAPTASASPSSPEHARTYVVSARTAHSYGRFPRFRERASDSSRYPSAST